MSLECGPPSPPLGQKYPSHGSRTTSFLRGHIHSTSVDYPSHGSQTTSTVGARSLNLHRPFTRASHTTQDGRETRPFTKVLLKRLLESLRNSSYFQHWRRSPTDTRNMKRKLERTPSCITLCK